MERRRFLGAGLAGQDSFEMHHVELPENTLFVRRDGKGRSLLRVIRSSARTGDEGRPFFSGRKSRRHSRPY